MIKYHIAYLKLFLGETMNLLLGGAIGDALGVPFELMNEYNPKLMAWDGKTFLGSKTHKLKPGEFSDDSQMQQIVAQSLIENKGFYPDDLSRRYLDWMVSGRARGYGNATYKALMKLRAGKHWSESGTYGSYGNGTAMRAAPFGLFFKDDINALIEVCKIDSRITHLSEEAEAGSLAIGLASFYIANKSFFNLDKIIDKLKETKVKSNIILAKSLVNKNISVREALRIIGTGPDVRQTVPAVLYLYFKYYNYNAGIIEAIKAGGDTDTTASILGCLFGMQFGLGENGIDSIYFSVEDYDKLVSFDNKLREIND
jgi:ADP-ribosylglycohydrolase